MTVLTFSNFSCNDTDLLSAVEDALVDLGIAGDATNATCVDDDGNALVDVGRRRLDASEGVRVQVEAHVPAGTTAAEVAEAIENAASDGTLEAALDDRVSHLRCVLEETASKGVCAQGLTYSLCANDPTREICNGAHPSGMYTFAFTSDAEAFAACLADSACTAIARNRGSPVDGDPTLAFFIFVACSLHTPGMGLSS